MMSTSSVTSGRCCAEVKLATASTKLRTMNSLTKLRIIDTSGTSNMLHTVSEVTASRLYGCVSRLSIFQQLGAVS